MYTILLAAVVAIIKRSSMSGEEKKKSSSVRIACYTHTHTHTHIHTHTHTHTQTHLLAEVVADLYAVLDLGASGFLAVDVDGEVSIHQLHLVLVPLGHTCQPQPHISNIRNTLGTHTPASLVLPSQTQSPLIFVLSNSILEALLKIQRERL